jgi:hypothetical protein
MKLTIPREILHRKIYLFSLALLVCCLPLSKYLLSISQFLLALNWLAEGHFRQKTGKIFQRPALMLFSSVFFVYTAGLLYSHNIDAGLHKVKNVLPLLLLPLVMGTSAPLSDKQIKRLFLLFSGAVVIASMVCIIYYLLKVSPVNGDYRKLSVFMLHICFSLLIVMAVFSLLYLTFYNRYPSTLREKILYFTIACFLIVFLLFLRSFTGIIIFLAMAIVFILNIAYKSNHPVARYTLLMLVSASILILTAFVLYTYKKNFGAKPTELLNLEKLTSNGNPYNHNITTGVLENGNYVDIYVCESELKQEWNKISQIPYDSLDFKGQFISGTIKRYLSSMGLRKDSAALSRLDKDDILRIEKGLANYRFHDYPGVYQRVYETLWEIQIITRSGFVQQHTFGQRLVFLKIAGTLIRDNFWLGVGTGDAYDAMLSRSKDSISEVDPLWIGKPHNQFAFFMLAFGITGFLWILFCWIYSAIKTNVHHLLLFNIFAGIMLISMLVVDPIESYDCVVFFAFFYCLFAFGIELQQKNKA